MPDSRDAIAGSSEPFFASPGALVRVNPARPARHINFSSAHLMAMFMLLDVACLGIAFAISYHEAASIEGWPGKVWKLTDGVFCVSLLYMMLASGAYAQSTESRLIYQLSRILVNGSCIAVLEWMALVFFGDDAKFAWPWNGPINIVSFGAMGMCAGRILVLHFLGVAAEAGLVARNVAVVGTGRQAGELVKALMRGKQPWTRIIGAFDDRAEGRLEPQAALPVRGSVEDLVILARQFQIDEVIVALPWGEERRLMEIFTQLKSIPANIRLAPDSIGYQFLNTGFASLDGVPLYNIYAKPISGWNALAKRLEDIILSGLLIIAVSPVLLACALAVKLSSPGPVLFRQVRYGYNNQLIRITKFRSMYHGMRDESAAKLATRGDPRITPVGQFLRRTSADELPQLFDVLMGRMSLVGPRPHALQAKAAGRLYGDIVGEYVVRHKVKPGITGWAQVMGWRGETDTEDKIVNRVECDLYYIENWSIFLDIEILLRTVGALFGENAY